MQFFKCTIIILTLFITQSSHAQFLKNALKTMRDAQEVIGEVKRTAVDVVDLNNELGLVQKDFNQKGKVARGNDGERNRQSEYAKIRGGKFKSVEWKPVVYVDNDIFPSAIVSLSTYRKDFNNELEVLSRPIGFMINSAAANQIIRWEIESSDKRFFDKVTGEFVANEANRWINIMPEIPWNYQALTQNFTSTPASVTYRFFDEKDNKIERTQPINYRSINDCVLRYQSTRMHYLFAAYVQESHPEVDMILKEGLQTGFVNSFSGYQVDKEGVISQVLAIWRALQLRQFRYSSITERSARDGKDISTQSVRTFDNSIKTSQANCVDGTVMFASILRKIGINTQIITVPGHCYLSVFLNREESSRMFIETTALSHFARFEKNISESDRDKYTKLFYAYASEMKGQYDATKAENKVIAEINVTEARDIINSIPVY